MPLAINGFKVCSKPDCPHNGQPQPLDSFSNHKRYPDGKQPQCKACLNATNAKYRKTEARKVSQTKYNLSQKGRDTSREYQQTDKVKEARRHRYQLKVANKPKKERPKLEKITVLFKKCTHPDCPCLDQLQPVENFYKSSSSRDGFAKWCKACKARWQKGYVETGRDKLVKQKYATSPKGQENKIRYSKSERGKQIASRNSIKMRQDPIFGPRVLARNRLNKAVRAGKIPHISTQTCTDCGNKARQYHHYLGYEPENWYDVRPLCLKCHRIADNPNT